MAGYMYIWEYVVRPEHVEAFERAYKYGGTWVELFRRAEGYHRTGLHRDQRDPHRYVTVDYWESLDAWEAFRRDFAAEFEALDAECDRYTDSERELGRYDYVE